MVDRNRVKSHQAGPEGCRACGEPEGEKHARGCSADLAQIGDTAPESNGAWSCECDDCGERFWTESYPGATADEGACCPFCGSPEIGFVPPRSSGSPAEGAA